MPSNYAAFEVKIDNDDGTSTLMALQAVHVYDVDGLAALSDVSSDAAGVVAAGTLPVNPGTLIRFWFYRPVVAGDATVGVCGYSEVFTT